tara:strand:+ start:32047 stop:32961 length:915 start_codon:yes stop_codon:yes gene_type:complete
MVNFSAIISLFTHIKKQYMMKKITLLAALFVAFSVNAQLFSDDFNASIDGDITFANWDNFDEDGDTEVWEAADIVGSTAEASPLEGLVADSDSWESGNANSPMTPDNYLITKDPIDLTGVADGMLTFTFGTYQNGGTFLEDRLAVYVSTSNDPSVVATETAVFDDQIGNVTPADDGGANSAIDITVDLSSFVGQSVYLVFRHFDTFDHNSALVDNVVVDGTLGLNDVDTVTFNHYFLADSSDLKLNASTEMSNIQLFSILGQEVVNRNLTGSDATINLANLTDGVYIARVTVQGQTETFKIIKR